jgi:hypothetical protein
MPQGSERYIWRHGTQCCGVDGCPGESCLRQASWRVLCSSRSGFKGSGVGASRLVAICTLVRGLGWRKTGGRTSVGVTMSRRSGFPQCRGWRRSVRDGGTVTGLVTQGRRWLRGRALLAWRHGAVPGGCGAGGRTPFEGSADLFWEGGVEEVREWVAQCHGMTPAFPHSSRTAPRMAAQRGLMEQRRDMIPRRCQRAGVAGIRLWPRRPRCTGAFNALVGGVGAASWVQGGLKRGRESLGGPGPLSEVETSPRGRQSLEQGGDSPAGASGPRARRRLARGGVRPSSKAETPWRGAWSSSETETHPRGTAAGRLVGRCGFLGRGPSFTSGCDRAECVLWFVGLFVYLLLFFERGVFRGH